MENFASFPDPLIENNYNSVYSPSDDSYLILDYFKQHLTPHHLDGIDLASIRTILDMGTGTGIIAIFFQLLSFKLTGFNPIIYASDISEEALDCAKRNEHLNHIEGKIRYIQSDLFKSFPINLKNKFDLIIFNPPYLPGIKYQEPVQEQIIKDRVWNGGSNGYEILLEFLIKISDYLNKDSQSLGYFITSSTTNLEKFYSILQETNLNNKILAKSHIFFEDIILNRISLKEI